MNRKNLELYRQRALEQALGGQHPAMRPARQPESYKQFKASEFYCPKCKCATPVRERLLLVLPSGEKYDYTCTRCGTSVGDKTT